MNRSENINELASALSQFQGEVSDVYREKQGYGYKYADLSQILEVVRPLLFKHGLSFSQPPQPSSDSKVCVETILMHKSGQWMSGTLEMPVEKGQKLSMAQSCGAVISYARRYSLCSILGITQSDDIDATSPKIYDAIISDMENPHQPEKKQEIKKEEIKSHTDMPASLGDRIKLINELLINNMHMKTVILARYNVGNINSLSLEQSGDCIERMRKRMNIITDQADVLNEKLKGKLNG